MFRSLLIFFFLFNSFILPPAMAAKERLVLMPLRVSEEDKALQGAMETAIVEGLQQKYEVFSGEQVTKKAREIFSKESRNTTKKECDETRCMQGIAEAFQAELIATTNVTKRSDGYFLALSIQNIFDNKMVYSKSLPCENCSAYRAVDKLKELSGASVQPVTVTNAATPSGDSDAEMALWNEVQKGNNADEYNVYLSQYPQGRFVALARMRINKLQEQKPQAAGASNVATPDNKATMGALLSQMVSNKQNEKSQAVSVANAINSDTGNSFSPLMVRIANQQYQSDNAIEVMVPEIAENGAVVPVTVNLSNPLRAGEKLLVVVDNNYLAYMAEPSGNVQMSVFSARVKMLKSSVIRAVIVDSGGNLRSAGKNVNVNLGVSSFDEGKDASSAPAIKQRINASGNSVEIKMLMSSPSSGTSFVKQVNMGFSDGTLNVIMTTVASMNPYLGVTLNRPSGSLVKITATDNSNRSTTVDGAI